MGVRPEGVVAVCAAGTMVAIYTAARRRRLLGAFAAFALAGLGFTVHPTGFTLLAPLLAGLPMLWSVVRVRGAPVLSLVRAAAVVSGGMTAVLAAFADGALRDYLRGETIFLAIQNQENWATEYRTLRIPAQRPPDGQLREAVGGPRVHRRARLVRRTRRSGKGPPRPGADRALVHRPDDGAVVRRIVVHTLQVDPSLRRVVAARVRPSWPSSS